MTVYYWADTDSDRNTVIETLMRIRDVWPSAHYLTQQLWRLI